MPIYRPKSVNNILAALTVTTLTIAGLALFNDRLWVKSDTVGNIVQVGNASDSSRFLEVSATTTTVGPWLRVRDGLTPTQNMFEVSNSTNAKQYFTVSSTATTVMGHSGLVSFLVGSSTDNGSSLTIRGNNAYLSSESGKALVFAAPGTNIMYFSVGGANRLILDSSGNAVMGGHTAATARFTISQNNATGNLFEINNANNIGVYSSKYFYVNTTSTNVIGALVVNGNVRTSNTNFVMSSTQTSVVLLPGAAAERTVQLPSCTATEVGRTVFIKNTKPAADGFSVTVDVLNGSGDRIDDVLFGTGGVTLNEMDASNAQTSGAVFRCESSGRWYAF